MKKLDILLYLGGKGALDKPIAITTSQIANDLAVSQQSISRWLINLEKKGLLFRKKDIRNYFIQVSPAGKKYLQQKRNQLNKILEKNKKMIFKGKIVSGLLDGKYYMGLKEYSEKIKSSLGFKPYPGTLNIKLNTFNDRQTKEKLWALKGIEIPGFKKVKRTFGSVRCFPCKILDIKGAIIIPQRSHYGFDVLEVISAFNLRKKLKLKNGHNIKVEVII